MENKTAQELGWWNKFKEKIGPVGHIQETFSQELASYMKDLRRTDNSVREKTEPLKKNIALARKLFEKKEYVQFFIPLTNFYNANKSIFDELKSLKNELLEDQYKLLSSRLIKDDYSLLQELEDSIKKSKDVNKSSSDQFESLVKTAGLFSYLAKLIDTKGRAIREFEKRHKKFYDNLRASALKLLTKADFLYENLKANFDKMAKHRLGREISSYLESVRDYNKNFESFEVDFIKFYNTYLQPVLEKRKEFDRVQEQLKADEEARKNFDPGIAYDGGNAPMGDGSALRTEMVAPTSNQEKSLEKKYLDVPELYNPESEKTIIESPVVENTEDNITPEEEKELLNNKFNNPSNSSNLEEQLKRWEEETKKNPKIKRQPQPQVSQKPVKAPIIEKVDETESEEEIAADIAKMMEEKNTSSKSKDTQAEEAKQRREEKAELNKSLSKRPTMPATPKTPLSSSSSNELINKLISLSENNVEPKKLAKAILDYSEKIESYDLEMSLKLLSIAEGIINK